MRKKWKPGRWYRIIDANGNLWMETSDPDEVESEWEKKKVNKGWRIQRLYVREQAKWKPWDSENG